MTPCSLSVFVLKGKIKLHLSEQMSSADVRQTLRPSKEKIRAIRLNVNSHYVKVNFKPAAVMNAAAVASHFSCRDATELAPQVALSSFRRRPQSRLLRCHHSAALVHEGGRGSGSVRARPSTFIYVGRKKTEGRATSPLSIH